MTKAMKNISSAATRMNAQKATTSTNTSKDVKKKDTAPAATDTASDMIQEHFKSLNPYKFMNNSEFLQLVAAQGEVAQKALLLQECGVIKDVVITTRVSSVSTEVSVTLNQYSSDEMKWCAEQKLFGDDQTMHKDADNLAKLSDYCDNEVKKLQSRSQSIIDRIKNFVGFSK